MILKIKIHFSSTNERRNSYSSRMKPFLIYPHQLFESIAILRSYEVVLIEEPLFFTQYTFHVQKLILHRASMKQYAKRLNESGIQVRYIEEHEAAAFYMRRGEVTCYDVADAWLEQKIRRSFDHVTVLKNPNFLNHEDESLFLHTFYTRRRKALGIWVKNGKPLHGKWSFDAENRQKLPFDIPRPVMMTYDNAYVDEARGYVKRFKTVGDGDSFYYPTSHSEARTLLTQFIDQKFHFYGIYQDAIDRSNSPLFHSLISSSLNIGLLDLEEIIECALKANAPFNAKEGFIRQIIGWREFMFSLYKRVSAQQRTTNFFGFERTMSPKLRNGESHIVPLDHINTKVLHTGYAHHIERLMIQGNWFLLTETAPDEVYRYFMSHYIDAYDWVMVGNVYGMSQYADGGLITTKPYISSSNYLYKMSSYPKNEAWAKVWDALYWRFMKHYSPKFSSNPRMKMQRALLLKMSSETISDYCRIADEFLDRLNE